MQKDGKSALSARSIGTVVAQALARYNEKDQATLSTDESAVVAMGLGRFKDRAAGAIKSRWNRSGTKVPASTIWQKFMLDRKIAKGSKRSGPQSCVSPGGKR
jgi:hypothetical protein